ncbi:DUF6115 domain-containing protein [Ruminiclostridium cellobioparum]|uniref:Regulatory protein luxR family n=1 Tax=Ruminiclostridium cellobioparum subsp. termitidis CT1112 TaxID=1195236 RepID=S0FI06_RUMCE|nr:hypothetical protein [Ruminiclostridium cellobioparum]EMS71470.1 regulatory protein luxR family [Ruminiclostridium cellobioparum subsp. termitidis CT1112]
MGAFYVSIIFLGILLIIGSLFFIVMDKVNGKDFFKEFDRKKEEMFNLIQDSEEMLQELNKMSDYVVTSISEKNQEFFDKYTRAQADDEYYQPSENLSKGAGVYNQMLRPAVSVRVNPMPSVPVAKIPVPVMPSEIEQVSPTSGNTHTKEAAQKKGRKAKDNIKRQEEIKPNEDVNPQQDVKPNEDVKLQQDEKLNEATMQQDVRLNEAIIPQEAEKHMEHLKVDDDINAQELIQPEEKEFTPLSTGPRSDIEADGNKSKLVLNNKRHEVLKMIEQGMTNDEIADRLKIGKGEINLIRGLSK